MTPPAAFPLPVTAFTLPLVAPFRGLTERGGVIVHGRAAGEFSPFPDYSTDADARWLVAAVEAALDDDPGPGTPVAVNAILPDVTDEQLPAAVERVLARTGCSTLKVKVGGRPTGAELHRVTAAVRAGRAHTDAFLLRLDGNGRFDLAAAREFLIALAWADVPVEYVEQPCDSLPDMKTLHADSEIPLAVDETIRRDRDFAELAQAADVAILKVAPLGGVRESAALAAALPLPIVISGAAESGVGVSRDAVAAHSLGAPDRAHGLGTGTLLAADLTTNSVVPAAGVIAATRVGVDPEALSRAAHRVSADDRAAWQKRLAAAWQRALALGLVGDDMLADVGAFA